MFALFATHLVLATLHEENHKFSVAAMIRTCDIELKSTDEGTGLTLTQSSSATSQ